MAELTRCIEALNAHSLEASGSLQWSSNAATTGRAAACRALSVALLAASDDVITSALEPLEKALHALLLDGRPQAAACFAAACQCVQITAKKVDDGELISSLLPLLIDWSGCTGDASLVGAHAHVCVCAVLPHAPLHDTLPMLLGTLALPAAPPAARERLVAQVLLVLLLGAGRDSAGVRPRLIPALAGSLCGLLRDARARTRRLARQALLVLMEAAPRAATEPFNRLPLQSQKQLARLAKQRASALGAPSLPPPPPPPPAPQTILLQAAARGMAARARARAAADFLSRLAVGDTVSVVR